MYSLLVFFIEDVDFVVVCEGVVVFGVVVLLLGWVRDGFGEGLVFG